MGSPTLVGTPPQTSTHPRSALGIAFESFGASLVAQTVKNLPAMQETRVRYLGWEGPLEKEMATHSRILAWKIPWTEEPGRIQRVRHD